MTQQITFNTPDLLLLGAGILVAVFFGSCLVVQQLLHQIEDKGRSSVQLSGVEANRCARATAASVTISFATALLVATGALALGLGWAKTIGTFVQWFLPDRALGFAILVSYAGLVTGLRTISPELSAAVRKLLD